MKKNIVAECSLIAAFLLCGLVLMLFALRSPRGSTVSVSVDGQVVVSFPLDCDTVYRIESTGGYNLLVISGGKAAVTEASCPDGLCRNMGSISRTGQSIICLPNHVVVEITGNAEEASADATAG